MLAIIFHRVSTTIRFSAALVVHHVLEAAQDVDCYCFSKLQLAHSKNSACINKSAVPFCVFFHSPPGEPHAALASTERGQPACFRACLSLLACTTLCQLTKQQRLSMRKRGKRCSTVPSEVSGVSNSATSVAEPANRLGLGYDFPYSK